MYAFAHKSGRSTHRSRARRHHSLRGLGAAPTVEPITGLAIDPSWTQTQQVNGWTFYGPPMPATKPYDATAWAAYYAAWGKIIPLYVPAAPGTDVSTSTSASGGSTTTTSSSTATSGAATGAATSSAPAPIVTDATGAIVSGSATSAFMTTTTSLLAFLKTGTLLGFPAWMVLGAGGVGAYFLMGRGSSGSSRRRRF